MKNILIAILLACTLAPARDNAANIVAGLLNAGVASWGYVEARQHREVRVYCNITAILFTLKAIGNFWEAAR